jgi:hypothetical protein
MLRNATTLTLVAGLCACSSDDEGTQVPDNSENDVSAGALLVITERESTDAASLHYLHVLDEWPRSGELDYDQAVELGAPGVAFVQGSALYFYHAQAGKIEKITVNEDGEVERGRDNGEEISFVGRGISGFDAEPVRVSGNVAFLVDEKSAQIARWNPSKMEIESVHPINEDALERDGLNVQFQLGVAAGSRVFTTANYRNWETNTVAQQAALGVFEQDSPGDVTIISDERCAPSVAIGPFTDQGHVYLVSDGAQGYDLLASPKKVDKPQCVVRMDPDADAFDEEYFIDLQELTGSPAIYMSFPMADHKLLVSLWSPDEDVSEYMTTSDAAWFWDRPPTYEYKIVDLDDKTVSNVDGLPRAAARSPKTLIVDEENYVQLFRDDRGSDLYRVTTDGDVEKVLENPGSTNVQFLGRL